MKRQSIVICLFSWLLTACNLTTPDVGKKTSVELPLDGGNSTQSYLQISRKDLDLPESSKSTELEQAGLKMDLNPEGVIPERVETEELKQKAKEPFIDASGEYVNPASKELELDGEGLLE